MTCDRRELLKGGAALSMAAAFPSIALAQSVFAPRPGAWRTFEIVTRLATGEATVKELAAPYDMSLAAVSKHLKVLEGAGLISRGRDAQYRPCKLEAGPMRDVAGWLESYRRFWEESLDRLVEHLTELQGKEPKDEPNG